MKPCYIIFFCFLLFEGCCLPGHHCPEYRGSFEVYNYSESDIVTILLRGSIIYPDTSLPEWEGTSDFWEWNTVTAPLNQDHWNFYKEKNRDTLCLFILSSDTINKYGWDKVYEDYNILARYDLCVTYESLKKLKFDVSYPPTEIMKDVKMYPSYDYLVNNVPNINKK